MKHGKMRKLQHRIGLENLVAAVLLIAIVIAAAVGVWAIASGSLSGATGSVSVTNEGSVISIDPSSGTGMVLFIINNHGPGSLNLCSVNILDGSGSSWSIKPTSKTAASLNTPTANKTSSFVASGANVGFIASTKACAAYPGDVGYLAIPGSQQASFEFDAVQLTPYFTPGYAYRATILPVNSAVVVVQVQASAS
jgi:hypothetical protein